MHVSFVPLLIYLDCQLTTTNTSDTIAIAKPTSSSVGADGDGQLSTGDDGH